MTAMKNWTLVFDLDGTLIDTAPDLAAATNHVMSELSLAPVDESEIRKYVGQGALVMIEQAAAAHGHKLAGKELYALFDVFLAHYTAHIADRSRPYDGLLAALDAAAESGATLAVCTNKLEAHARQLLDALGLSPRFKALTGRDSLGVWKPDPGHLTGTIALAGGQSATAIMIGDSETDIATAKAAGVPVIAVDFGYSDGPVHAYGPDVVISHYDQLLAAIERLSECAVASAG